MLGLGLCRLVVRWWGVVEVGGGDVKVIGGGGRFGNVGLGKLRVVVCAGGLKGDRIGWLVVWGVGWKT